MTDARWSVLLTAAAFLVRLVSWTGSAVFGTDSCHYLLMADWMRQGRFHDALLMAYHPLYPILIAAARALSPSTEGAGGVVGVLLGAAAVAPLFLMMRAVFGRPAAVLGALLYAFHPAIIEVQGDVMTEGPFMFFLFGTMWLLWRVLEAPSLERSVVLGAAAAGAFLTRVEGILAIALAIGWPLADLLRRPGGIARRLGGWALTGVVVVILVSPFLLWVRSVRGHPALSYKPSAMSAERAVGETPADVPVPQSRGSLYGAFFKAAFHLSLYGALLPFYVLGLPRLRGVGLRALLYYFSFPLGHLGGILWVLREHNSMSERYIMAPMSLLAAVAAAGGVALLEGAARRWPESRSRPALSALALGLLLVAPAVRCFKMRRTELLSCKGAAEWIRKRDPGLRSLSGVEQVCYYCGCRSYYLPVTRESLETFLKHEPLDYIVYSDKDVQKRPEYVAMLRSWSRLESPLEYQGPPGTWNLYFQRVK